MYRPRLSLVLLDDARGGPRRERARGNGGAVGARTGRRRSRRWRSRECDCGPSSPSGWSAAAPCSPGPRCGARRATRKRPTLIVGAGDVGQLAAKRRLEQPESGCARSGSSTQPARPRATTASRRCSARAGTSSTSSAARRRARDPRLLPAPTRAAPDAPLRGARGRGRRSCRGCSSRSTSAVALEHLGGLPLLALARRRPERLAVRASSTRSTASSRRLAARRCSRRCCSRSRSPCADLARARCFFRQRRVGRDGQEFDLLKFRSMRAAAGRRRPASCSHRRPRARRRRGRRPAHARRRAPAPHVARRAAAAHQRRCAAR